MRKRKDIRFTVNDSGCHICTSHYINHYGYPIIGVNRKIWVLSRYIYTEKIGPIPEGFVIRHSCDNRACINIEHLSIGSIADNNRDRKDRGRNANKKGENNPRAKINWEIVEEIRASPLSQNKLAKKYGLSQGAINFIKNNKTWVN